MNRQPSSGDNIGQSIRWYCPERQARQHLAVRFESTDTGAVIATGDGWRFDLSQPQRLQPVTIIKPWGEERWYSGMEARGQSIVLGKTGSLPLGAYLALDPDGITGSNPIVLLKLLLAKAERPAGELYCEVHREKAEAYLVTGLDADAWPTGRAELRYGIAAAARARYPRANDLRRALQAAAEALEAEPASLSCRATFDQFIARVPLTVGSRIQIARGVPHGLPHGVRVIEFQTPSYERLILAASQPVLTQAGWDCAAAAATLRLSAPNPEPTPDPSLPPGQRRLARFSDFGARVLYFNDTTPSHPLPPSRGAVVLCCTQGQVQVGSLTLSVEQAALVPAAAVSVGLSLSNPQNGDACAVIAAPDY